MTIRELLEGLSGYDMDTIVMIWTDRTNTGLKEVDDVSEVGPETVRDSHLADKKVVAIG